MGADKSVRGPLHPHYRRDGGGPRHQQTLGSSPGGGGRGDERQVSADGRATAEVSRRQPTLVSSLLTRGQGLHGQWVGPKRAALIQLAVILFAFCVCARRAPFIFPLSDKSLAKTWFRSLFLKIIKWGGTGGGGFVELALRLNRLDPS